MTQTLPFWKRAVLFGVALVAIAGIWVAFNNLPVITGCAFYGSCEETP